MRHRLGTCTYGNNPAAWASNEKCPSCYDTPEEFVPLVEGATRQLPVQVGNTPSATPSRANRPGDTQALPTINDQPWIADIVKEDIEARKQVGIKRYGTPLQPFNDRNALVDAYEEVLDLACYLKQRIIEEEAVDFGECPNCAVAEGRDVWHRDPGDGLGEYHRVVDGL